MTDPVHRPAHYTRGSIEVRDFVADQQLNFNRGSAVKYICRAGFKDPSREVEDLEKAIACIRHEIEQLNGETATSVNSLDLVREFHAAFGQDDADEPRINNDGINELRLKLIREETEELALALAEGNRVEVLDALTDLQYVLDGAYLQLGFAHVKDAALREVHRSNMTKLGADGKPVRRADGKIIKGPNYSPPNLAPLVSLTADSPPHPPQAPQSQRGLAGGEAGPRFTPAVEIEEGSR